MRSLWGAVLLVGCGSGDGSALFAGSPNEAPHVLERDGGLAEPDAAVVRPGEADAGSGGKTTVTASGGSAGASAGMGGATVRVDAGSGGATIASGGRSGTGGSVVVETGGALGTGGAPETGGVMGTGGKACTTATHCVYPRISDGCPCDNACPTACASSTVIEKIVRGDGVVGEQLTCTGACVSNAAKDCCIVPTPACIGDHGNVLSSAAACPTPTDPHKVAACRNWACVEVCGAGYTCP